MKQTRIFLDYNAGAPLRFPAMAAMRREMRYWGNPSAVHHEGRAARYRIESARDQIAQFCQAGNKDAMTVIFTSSATEANNHVLRCSPANHIFLSPIEHPSVYESARQSAARLSFLRVDRHGRLDLQHLEQLLRENTRRIGQKILVSVMAANNETGVIQPIAMIAGLARQYGASLHCDAVQAAGKIDLAGFCENCDSFCLSAHKIGGPAGIGALILRKPVQLATLLAGGGQEHNHRAGSEAAIAIAGFAAATKAVREEWVGKRKNSQEKLAQWREKFEKKILHAGLGAVIASKQAERTANTSCIALPAIAATTQLMALDLAGFAISSGAACSSGKVQRSTVLDAMGYAPEISDAAIRVSTGWASKAQDLVHFANAWCEMATRLRQKHK